MPPGDEAGAAVESLTPGQVAALARALRDVADELMEIRRTLTAREDADRTLVERRTLAWSAVASLAMVARDAALSRPGQLFGALIAAIIAAAVAQALRVDIDTLRALVGLGA